MRHRRGLRQSGRKLHTPGRAPANSDTEPIPTLSRRARSSNRIRHVMARSHRTIEWIFSFPPQVYLDLCDIQYL